MKAMDGEPVRSRTYRFMSISHTNAIRGVLIFIIILYHESLYLDVDIMPREGAYAVMMFFFLSGYGLYLSHEKPNYLRDFVQKKIIGLMIRYWIIELFVIVALAILYLSTDEISDRVIGLSQAISHWYVIQLLFFYFLFYIAFILFSNKRYSILLLCIVIPFLMYGQFRYYDSNLYLRSGLGFIIGLVFARYKDYFDKVPLILRVAIIFGVGCALFFNGDYSHKVNVYLTPLLFLTMVLTISSIDFKIYSLLLVIIGLLIYYVGSITCGTAIMLAGLCEFTYTSTVFDRLGIYSLEAYLIHQSFMYYFYGEVGITDPLWLAVVVIIVTLVLSVIIKNVSDVIIKRYNGIVTNIGNKGL